VALPPVGLGERSLAALAILVVVAALYGVLGAFGVTPLPGSLAALSRSQQIGHTRAIVGGYYITQHFTAMGTSALPPYVFAAGAQPDAPGVHVAPALPDVRAGHVAALIDTATGDGSEASPFAIHTIARWDVFVTWVSVGVLVAVAFAFWLAGTVVALIRRRA
jgi:hypothetical protein